MTRRQPRGIPTGGEFAANEHDEVSSSLRVDPDDLVEQIREGRGDYHGALDALEEMASPYRDEASGLADQVRDQRGDYLVALEELRDLIDDENPSDPFVVGTDPERYRAVAEYLDGRSIESVSTTRSQFKTAMNDADGKKAKGVSRIFDVDALNGGGEHDIYAPKDGTPIAIISRGGHSTFRVRSGHAIIVADDISGTKIEASGGAKIVVLTREQRDASIVIGKGASVTVVAHAGSRGYITGDGTGHVVSPEGVTHNFVNTTTDGFLPANAETPF